MVFAIIGMAAGLVSAVGTLVCVGLLLALRGKTSPERTETAETDGGDAALREGILNLLRYDPAGSEEKEA